MTRNGNRIVRPILNAVRSSETMNAGIGARIGTSSMVGGARRAGDVEEQLEVGVVRVREQELCEAAAARRRARAGFRHLAVKYGLPPFVVHLHRDRRRHEHGHEQREPDEDLVRRRGGRAEAGAHEAEHDDEAHEAGARQDDRGQQRDDRQEDDHADRARRCRSLACGARRVGAFRRHRRPVAARISLAHAGRARRRGARRRRSRICGCVGARPCVAARSLRMPAPTGSPVVERGLDGGGHRQLGSSARSVAPRGHWPSTRTCVPADRDDHLALAVPRATRPSLCRRASAARRRRWSPPAPRPSVLLHETRGGASAPNAAIAKKPVSSNRGFAPAGSASASPAPERGRDRLH